MPVRITFSNNEELTINEDTHLFAWNSDDAATYKAGYYATMVYEGSNYDGTEIGTVDQVVGLQGLFGSVDWFATRENPETVYKTSSIVSLKSL